MEETKLKKDIENILSNFKTELKNDIPSFFETDTEKKAFYNACEKSLLLKNFLDCIPPKTLYYSDFTKYIKYDLKSGYAKDFDCALNERMKMLKSVRHGLGYPIYDFIQKSLYSFDDIHLYDKIEDIDTKNDDAGEKSDPNDRKKLIILAHSPFFLYYIIKYWEYLPVPASVMYFDSLNKGILPIYRKLKEYYMNAEHKDAVITRYIAESVLGGKYFSDIVGEFFLNSDNKLKKMDGLLQSKVINVFVLIRHLPGEELKTIFLKTLKTKVLEKYNEKDKTPYEALSEPKNIEELLLSFVEEILMFIVKTNVIFPTYFMRSISKSVEPNVTDNESKIKEGTIGISMESLYNIRQRLADESGVNDEKNEVANTIEILEHIDGNNQDMVISMFYGRYYRSTNPFIEIQKICASCSCTYQTACKKYAVQVIGNKQ